MAKIHVNLDGRTILVTGSPGFIGANLVLRLLRKMKDDGLIDFHKSHFHLKETIEI